MWGGKLISGSMWLFERKIYISFMYYSMGFLKSKSILQEKKKKRKNAIYDYLGFGKYNKQQQQKVYRRQSLPHEIQTIYFLYTNY